MRMSTFIYKSYPLNSQKTCQLLFNIIVFVCTKKVSFQKIYFFCLTSKLSCQKHKTGANNEMKNNNFASSCQTFIVHGVAQHMLTIGFVDTNDGSATGCGSLSRRFLSDFFTVHTCLGVVRRSEFVIFLSLHRALCVLQLRLHYKNLPQRTHHGFANFLFQDLGQIQEWILANNGTAKM